MGCCCFCRASLPLFAWKKGVFLPRPEPVGKEGGGEAPDPAGTPERAVAEPDTRDRPRAGVDIAGHKGEEKEPPWEVSLKSPSPPGCRPARRRAAGGHRISRNKLRCGGSSPGASSAPSALGIRFTGDEAAWSPRATGQHSRASAEAATSSGQGPAGCAAAPPRPPPENEVFPAPASNPGSGESREIVGI